MAQKAQGDETHRVFLVDDHPVMREGYASLIDAEPDIEVCGEAASAEEAFEKAAGPAFSVAVVDLSLPGANGLELVRRLRAVDPDALVLVVSAHDEALYAERALSAGARGYLMKHESAGRFVEAVRTVLGGDLYLSEGLRARLLGARSEFRDAPTTVERLTDRELEVFEHFGHGKSTREVAEAMGVAVKTVESHRVNIKRKLGVEEAAEFTRRAVVWAASPHGSSSAQTDMPSTPARGEADLTPDTAH